MCVYVCVYVCVYSCVYSAGVCVWTGGVYVCVGWMGGVCVDGWGACGVGGTAGQVTRGQLLDTRLYSCQLLSQEAPVEEREEEEEREERGGEDESRGRMVPRCP